MLLGSSGEALTKVSSKDPPPPPGINLLNEVSVHKTKHTLEKVAKDVDGGRRVRFWCVFGLSEHHLSTRCFLSRVQLSGEMCASVCVCVCSCLYALCHVKLKRINSLPKKLSYGV